MFEGPMVAHLKTESPKSQRQELSSPYKVGKGFGTAVLAIHVNEIFFLSCQDDLARISLRLRLMP
jgi:hypothetical protein